MNTQSKESLYLWLFKGKQGKEITFPKAHFPYVVFEKGEWGGSCAIGDCVCAIVLRHNKEAPHGERLEVRYPYKELGGFVPLEQTIVVGYMKIEGNIAKGGGKCYFEERGKKDRIYIETPRPSEQTEFNFSFSSL